MAALISHPFRLAPAGVVATVDDTSDQYIAEQLAMLILTKPGERPLVPDLGVSDPTFIGFDGSTLQEQVDAFGPPCRILDVTITPASDTRQDVEITFTRGEDDDEVAL